MRRASAKVEPPEDKSITALYVGNLSEKIGEKDLSGPDEMTRNRPSMIILTETNTMGADPGGGRQGKADKHDRTSLPRAVALRGLSVMDCDAERLAFLVGQRRPIYDFTLKEHNNRDLLDAQWEEIALIMNTTVAHCKAKWCNIRNCYSRYLRTTRNVPSPLTGRKKKKWYLADTLTFLDPFMSQTRKHEHTFEELPLEVIHNFKEDPESSDSQNIQQQPMGSTELKTEEDSYEPKRKKPKSGYMPNELDFLYTSKLNTVSKDSFSSADPDFDFFKCLFNDYKKLRQRRQRKFKEEMLSTLHRYLDEEEDELSDATTPPKTNSQTNFVDFVNQSQRLNYKSPRDDLSDSVRQTFSDTD